MAQKIIAIKIDVQGTADQKKKIVGLELNLKKLTDQQKKLKKQVKDGVITNDQYAKSIAKVNLGLKGTRRQLLVTRQAMLGIDGFTTRLGKSFKKFGTQVSGAFVGLFAAQKLFQMMSDGVNTVKDFEQQMAKVKALTGATGEEFLKLEKSARDLGSSTQFTATQVGKLQEEYAKLGFNTQEILDASAATLDLALATGSDLAQAAEVAASTLNSFGLEAKDTKKVVDLMAESFSSTPLDINKFQESMKLVAPTAKAVGESIQDTTAKLGLLAKNGLSGSIAGTQLSRVFIELNKKGISLDEAMEQVSSSTNKLGTATDLVKDRGAKALLIFAEQSKELKKLTNNFQDSTGEAEKMAKVVGDTLNGALKELGSVWEGFLLDLNEGTGASKLFERSIRFLARNFQNIIKLLVHVGSVFVAYKALLIGTRIQTALLSARQAMATASTALFSGGLKKAKTAMMGLNTAVKSNPIGLLMSAIALVLPFLVDFADKTDDVTKAQDKANEAEKERQALIKVDLRKLYEARDKLSQDSLKSLKTGLQEQMKIEDEALSKQIADNEFSNSVFNDKIKRIKDEIKEEKLSLKSTEENTKMRLALKKELADDTRLNIKEKEAEIKQLQKKLILDDSSLDKINKIKVQIKEVSDLIKNDTKIKDNNTEAEKKRLAKLAENSKKAAEKAKKEEEAKKAAEKLANEKIIADKKLADDKLKAEEKLIKESEKLRNEAYLLEITDKEDLEIAKLRIAIQAQEDEIKSSIANKDLKNAALLDLEANRLAKEKDIKDKFTKSDKDEQDLIDAENRKIKNQGAVDVANELAINLTNIQQQKADREKDIALASLDAELEGGLITQQQFEAKKLAIEKQAFEKKKKLEIANVVISLASEIASIAANSAGNPLNAFTAGTAGAAQNAILAGIAVARSAVQIGAIASQKFADGGFTGGGSGIADETGFKQAGIVHEGEYVVPKHVLGTSEGSSLVGALENMRTNQPMPNLGIGYANGGMVGGGSLDLQGLENRMAKAISNSLSSIQVTNVATETTSQAIKVNNIEQEASFG